MARKTDNLGESDEGGSNVGMAVGIGALLLAIGGGIAVAVSSGGKPAVGARPTGHAPLRGAAPAKRRTGAALLTKKADCGCGR